MSAVELIDLHVDPAEGAHVRRLPAWLPPTGRGTYWHQPRSAYWRPEAERLPFQAAYVVSLWCGQSRFYATFAGITGEPPDDFKCGTCLGRRLGYARDDGAIHQPRDWFGALPRECFSSTPDPATGYRTCIACGRRVNAARGWSGRGLARHAPADALADRCKPCPRHGWRMMGERGGWSHDDPPVFVCGAHGCAHVGGPRSV